MFHCWQTDHWLWPECVSDECRHRADGRSDSQPLQSSLLLAVPTRLLHSGQHSGRTCFCHIHCYLLFSWLPIFLFFFLFLFFRTKFYRVLELNSAERMDFPASITSFNVFNIWYKDSGGLHLNNAIVICVMVILVHHHHHHHHHQCQIVAKDCCTAPCPLQSRIS